MAKPPSPTPANIRLTITVTPEVHAAFVRMAQVASLPIGRCMGEWLGDTLEGVEFLTTQLERAREAPRQVVKEMRQLALGSADLADELLRDMRAGKVAAPAAADRASAALHGPTTAAAQAPRLVIRGGKSPGKTRTR
jgi:hypothetical protein